MSHPWATARIRKGMEVIDSHGDPVGRVKEVLVGVRSGFERFFTIRKGLLFRHEYLVPREAVRAAEGDRVTLGISKDDVKKLPEHDRGAPPSEEQVRKALAVVRPPTLEDIGRMGAEPDPGTGEQPAGWAFVVEEVRTHDLETARRRAPP